MPKPSLGITAWIIIALVLVVLEVLQLTGIIRLSDIAANFYLFVFSLVIVSVLAIIGAIFLGITIAHRFMVNRGFTPFEEEMLSMKEQINRMEEMIENLTKK